MGTSGKPPGLGLCIGRKWLGLEHEGLSYFRLPSNFRVPFAHKHLQQEEVYVLVGGSTKIKLDDEVVGL